VIYGSPCGRAAVKWGQPSSPEYLTNASVFFIIIFFIGRRQSSIRALVLTHINVVVVSPIHNIIRTYIL